ncbi:hypothetical protein, partial [Bombilactobacillus bombi]|uniref:hypothetical protein n=1 Tax=Bombilactobacillus bombi TaxID=1303590 RepID=UPI0015E5BD7C
DIIAAQDDGLTASEYFGQQPALAAQEIVANFSKISWKQRWQIFAKIFITSCLWTLLTQLSNPHQPFNVTPFILNGLWIFVLINIIFKLIHYSIYWQILNSRIIKWILSWLMAIVILTVFIGIQLIQVPFLSFNLSLPMKISLNMMILLLPLSLIIWGDKILKALFWAISPWFLVIAINNLLVIFNYPILQHQEYVYLSNTAQIGAWLWCLLYLWRFANKGLN